MVKKTKKESVGNEKLCAILSYLLIGIIWYFADEKMKKSSFANYHAKQGLTLLITSVILGIVAGAIPFIGWFILAPIFNLAVLVLLIIGIINAAKGNEKELPIIGSFAKKFNF
jgi:uncharacterized membrane protein